MRIAYLVLAHNTPNHLRRLVAALRAPSSSVFIHLDRKSDAKEFLPAQDTHAQFIDERVAVYWGDFSQVEATLLLMRKALAHRPAFDRLVLLSGSDYPVRPVAGIEDFFRRHPETEFISLVTMPNDVAGKPIRRLVEYCLRPGDSWSINFIKRVLLKSGVMPRKRNYAAALKDLVPYGGSTWWSLTRAASEYILSFVEQNPRVVAFFRNTRLPDESFFHTVLGNSHFRDRIARGLTYTDWSAGGPSPATFSTGHVATLSSVRSFSADDVYGPGDILFARKFPDDSAPILALMGNIPQLPSVHSSSTDLTGASSA